MFFFPQVFILSILRVVDTSAILKIQTNKQNPLYNNPPCKYRDQLPVSSDKCLRIIQNLSITVPSGVLPVSTLRVKGPLLHPDCLDKREGERVFCVESCSEQVAEIVKVRCLVNNYEISSSITSVSSRRHPRQGVAAGAGQGGRGQRQESRGRILSFRYFPGTEELTFHLYFQFWQQICLL